MTTVTAADLARCRKEGHTWPRELPPVGEVQTCDTCKMRRERLPSGLAKYHAPQAPS